MHGILEVTFILYQYCHKMLAKIVPLGLTVYSLLVLSAEMLCYIHDTIILISQHLENQVKTLADTKASLMSQLQTSEEESESLQVKLEKLEQEKQHAEELLQGEVTLLQKEIADVKGEKEALDIKLQHEIEELKVLSQLTS